MNLFVDTSAFFAVMDADDRNHKQARQVWQDALNSAANLICTNYILVETLALLQNRLGMPAVRSFQADVVPILRIEWVSETLHAAAISALLVANRRQLSLVDCVSFETMRILGLKQVFAFDPDFSQQGFHCLP
jgi:uncharacterized protein